jgi:hypothetical protein
MIIPGFPDYLADLHHAWHDPSAHRTLPSRVHPRGSPGGGLEFLTFHHTFMVQAFAWMATQTFNPSLDVSAWTSIPAELKAPELGWTEFTESEERRIVKNDPRYANADDLGTDIELGIHNSWIHGAVATHFHEDVVGTFHSPQSTYFYKIHGLVDHWWKIWRIMNAVVHPWDTKVQPDIGLDRRRLLEAAGVGRATTALSVLLEEHADLSQRLELLELRVTAAETLAGGTFLHEGNKRLDGADIDSLG